MMNVIGTMQMSVGKIETMNERIKELLKQSTIDGIPQLDIEDSIDYEKFAELIVRECANYAFSDDQDHKAMLKHFGIEQ